MYKAIFKRVIDFFSALIGLIILSPVIVLISIISLIVHKNTPFFHQLRPGKNEIIFKIIKFKTMNDLKDENGVLLPDENRLTKWGKFLRITSLDEIPQLINVLKGEMSLIGPRPLIVKYLPYYTQNEKLRHSVRPGITGLAQVHGRNNLDWDSKLKLDVEYAQNINFQSDIKILLTTILNVIISKDVAVNSYSMEPDLDKIRTIPNKNV
ncbi:sugar transferase [Mariniflexile gromovii]|uniref:Sugar transferase n=1 Tax=Mariniflexile gromovii TaxID=362523 RepID=A0ABS4BPG9_9FLAO|nr:sugar transferase [Mariniflexile gromovii]MBP0902480.1 sugar transferase [Mariniflexile gromovii]